MIGEAFAAFFAELVAEIEAEVAAAVFPPVVVDVEFGVRRDAESSDVA